jgi:hypothetical protein
MKVIEDSIYWTLPNTVRRIMSRKNCRLCKGKGSYWTQVNTDNEYVESDLIRCKCTFNKDLPKFYTRKE